jgi:hypothetical protein
MTPRLALEHDTVLATLARTRRARLLEVDDEGRLYLVAFEVRTLVRGNDGVVREEERTVPVAYELAARHPLESPIAIALQPDLFNPHVIDPRPPAPLRQLPIFCLGQFRPEHRLADWLSATYGVLAFQRLTTKHGLNPEAIAWARHAIGEGRLPIDARPFFEPLRRGPTS